MSSIQCENNTVVESGACEIKDLKCLLQQSFGKAVDILKCHIRRLTAPGENYGSLMLSIEVTLSTENGNCAPVTKHLVAKMCPESEMLCSMFNIWETFKKELLMYTVSVPVVAELEDEYGVTKNRVSDMFAKCFGGRFNLKSGDDDNVVDKDAVLLLENLKVLGYDVGDRLVGFDVEHAELILKNLARYHGAFMALKQLKPGVFEEKIVPTVKPVKLGGDLDDKAVDLFVSEVTDVLGKVDECVPYVEKIRKSIVFNVVGDYRTNAFDNPFSSLIHTDFWLNNTMVLWDEDGKPLHNKIVDLQLPIYNSVVYDLIFFVFSSVKPSVLYNNVDHFFRLYYDALKQCLQEEYKLAVASFTWQAFMDEISTIAPIEIGHVLCMYRPILTMRGEIKDMASFSEDTMNQKMAVTDDYEMRVTETALYFIRKGWVK